MKKLFSIFAVLALILSLFTFNASADSLVREDGSVTLNISGCPEFKVTDDGVSKYTAFALEDGTFVIYEYSNLNIECSAETLSFVFLSTGPVGTYTKYTVSGESWVVSDTSNIGDYSTIRDNIVSVCLSSVNLYDGDTLFFPLPLHQEVEQMTAREMVTKFQPTLGGTMKILIVCGVGLIALLMSLPLLLKVFHRLRIR